MNAWYSNNTFGAGRYSNPNNTAYSAGQVLGDVASMVTGAMEVLMGATIAGGGGAGGLALAPATGGVSIAVSAGAVTAGYALAGHGGTAMFSGAQNVGQDLSSMSTNNGGEYGSTPGGSLFTKHGSNRAEARNISGDQIDNVINNYTDTFDASKGKTGYYDSVSDMTVITGSDGEIITTHYGKPVQLTNQK